MTFFTFIFQWLKCSYSLSVAGVLLKVVLNEGEIIMNIFTPESTKLRVLVENENQNDEKWVHRFVQKSSKWGPFWHFWRPFWNSANILGEFFNLKIALSQNLNLKCEIPLNQSNRYVYITRQI